MKVYFCNHCGITLSDPGHLKCPYCESNKEGISVAEVSKMVSGVKAWMGHGYFDEARQLIAEIREEGINSCELMLLEFLMEQERVEAEELVTYYGELGENTAFQQIISKANEVGDNEIGSILSNVHSKQQVAYEKAVKKDNFITVVFIVIFVIILFFGIVSSLGSFVQLAG